MANTAPAAQPKNVKSSFDIMLKQTVKNWQLILMVLPAVIIVILFNYVPMYGVTIAFQDYTPSLGFLGSPWVGFKHFIRFFNSYNASLTNRNTVLLSI